MYRLAVVCAIVMLSLDQPLEAETIPIYSNDFSVGAGNEWSYRVLDTTPTGRPFLGRFTNQDTTRLSVGAGSIISPDGLPRHNLVSVSFDLYIIHSWDGALCGDQWMLSVDGGPVLLDTSFSNPFHGTAYNPQNYPAGYGGDLYPAHTGAAEVNTLGYWNVYPTDFGDSVYHLSFTFPHVADAMSFTFRANGFTGTPLSGLQDESWGLDNVAVAVIVPEPATLSMLALASLLLARRRRAARVLPILVAGCLLLGSAGVASADVFRMGGTRNADGSWTGLASLETVPVGNAGNAADTTGYGRVDYDYRLGKYEVTAGQYTEFLNKVAGVDTYGLYDTYMWSNNYHCGIERFAGNGTIGSPYQYRVASNWANRPVTFVSFWNSCRFANWLHNGQPTGTQGNSTTEDGAYTLTAQRINNNTVSRNGNWKYAVASENEWYKAAYYDPATGTYYDYPTSSNSRPSNNLLTPDGGNNANFWDGDITIGMPYWRTVVGEFELSDSPYGTFDQGGNVWEWNETVVDGSYRGLRGGSFYPYEDSLLASDRKFNGPMLEGCSLGFRVVQVPEPTTLAVLALGSLLFARRRRAMRVVPVLAAAALLTGPTSLALADVFHMPSGQKSLAFVTVGNPGNAGDARFGRANTKYPYDQVDYGAVGYTYQMGTYDVTSAQYCQFLNAVARSDAFGLYHPAMATGFSPCGILRSGSSGNCTYSVVPGREDFPVRYVSWGDAARFANWLTNGQPTGPQGPLTTETGSYALNGRNNDTDLMAVTRSPGATYVIPSQDEWYKAAFYKGGSANAGYWLYPTRSDTAPSNTLSSTGTNNANFVCGTYPNLVYTDPVNYFTPVGAFAASPGPYGTFDQGGNVWQWTEGNMWGTARVLRGGECTVSADSMQASRWGTMSPSGDGAGFRMALVPEPATLSLLALGGLLVARRRAGRVRPVLLAAGLLASTTSLASADVFHMGGTRDTDGSWNGLASLETVPVGDAENAGELSGAGAGGYGQTRICGAVAYPYNIGKYEVTAGQYCEFLNAVAQTDTYGLYSTDMWSGHNRCRIQRNGSSDSYSYSVAADWANRPVNYVSFGDACRFANWLHNGQPSGPQNAATTEDGAYALNGATSDAALTAVTRKVGWKWAITSEDEWYKAAYYKGGSTNAGYWDYPTGSDLLPSNALTTPDGGNNANCYGWRGSGYDFSIGYPYFTTEVGAFERSESPYGTFDQGGNVWEWTEAVLNNSGRYVWGGSCTALDYCMKSSWANVYGNSGSDSFSYGFRVVQVPEPATLSLLALGGLLMARRRAARMRPILLAVILLAGLASQASADVFHMGGTRNPATGQWTGSASLEFVPVGDAGNAADPLVHSDGTSGYGSVAYTYRMGTYDVTAGQYCEFLNAVAKTDTYGLYNGYMATTYSAGCGILQGGNAGSYAYSVVQGRENFPVNRLSWGDAARFCNWLSNGQPTGPQGPGTTESGSYTLTATHPFYSPDGTVGDLYSLIRALKVVTRNPGATYVIPTEDEWYKAAYYKGGSTSAGYWLYPTKSNAAPSNVLSSTGTNNANFYSGGYADPTNYLTAVGAFAGSPGPYGTFDMGGDVFQWNEANIPSWYRGVRGGAFGSPADSVQASSRYYGEPTDEPSGWGLRVALVPEPATLSLLALGSLWLARRRRAARVRPALLAGCLLLGSAGSASADVFHMGGTRDLTTGQWTGSASVEFVTVGDPGNTYDPSRMSPPWDIGSVGYTYQMGKYDATAGQYCQFLNAVAAADPYGLYNPGMRPASNLPSGTFGITRSGTPGSYAYSVTGNPNFPMNRIGWDDAARFCNWLANGQPTGAEGPGTTETGSYTLSGTQPFYSPDGTVSNDNFPALNRALIAVTRNAGATYVIPTENEWYKAAYYKGGGTNAGYWTYPTGSGVPSNVLSSTGTHNANFYDNGYTDPTNYLTPVGAFAGSPGPYGTFDMGGNVHQWDEAIIDSGFGNKYRGVRGGVYDSYGSELLASHRNATFPSLEFANIGFRVALVPEPTTLAVLAVGGLLIARRRRVASVWPILLVAAALLAGLTTRASADVFRMGGTRDPATGQWTGLASLEFVTVGDAGNAADTLTGHGSVGYMYQMGKYDVTAGQYCAFLNAVAQTDSYGLYHHHLSPANNLSSGTFGITRSGTPGSYAYSVTGNPNFPIDWTNWADAARFCNWLTNGQPTGAEGPGTTETGSYTLSETHRYYNADGFVADLEGLNAVLMSITRNAGATYVIPTENEWYKAAYYKGGGTNAGYWLYPTQSNAPPSNVLSSIGTNNANYYKSGYTDPTNLLTAVGAFASSPGPYGTFDQGGDVHQWNETIINGRSRGLRSGALSNSYGYLKASSYFWNSPAYYDTYNGFRVALVPEPTTLAMLALGGLLIVRGRRAARVRLVLLATGLLAGSAGLASADVFCMGGTRNPATGQWTGLASLETVPVGDAGNAGELSGRSVPGGLGFDRTCGAVAYDYRVGKYEVTAGQYCEFLNAVARVDTYNLYNPVMWSSPYGCKIERFGGTGTTADPYHYRVATDWANRPVNLVDWGDACRFANWLHNGQPAGEQNALTTEDGAYALNGTTYYMDLLAVARKATWQWAVTSEDEWYKAAYYKGGGTNAGYWDYPTGSNTRPGTNMNDTSGNNANYYTTGYLIGSPYYRTEAGAFENSKSHYGTFDQGGNVFELNESVIDTVYCGWRGGGFFDEINEAFYAGIRFSTYYPTYESAYVGFRVVQVPEPATLFLFALGGLLLARRRATRMMLILLVAGLLAVSTNTASADVFNMGGTRNPATGQWAGLASLEFVTVGDVGNAADWTGHGAVSYTYQMGEYDVTAGQYCQFLNAVAAQSDVHGLYDAAMANPPSSGRWTVGCGITRTGNAGSYAYSITGNPNFPVNWISWDDAARFCNWLAHGQPTGLQGPATTENGSYDLSSTEAYYAAPDVNTWSSPSWMALNTALAKITRQPGATYVIPTSDEWYKAAYYKGGGVNAGYWRYSACSNAVPSNVLTGTNSVNWPNPSFADPVNYLTTVGAFARSPGPYGTFDMGGNVSQWNEEDTSSYYKMLRGGGLNIGSPSASNWNNNWPSIGESDVGFRVALVPEPATLSLLALGGLLLARRRRA